MRAVRCGRCGYQLEKWDTECPRCAVEAAGGSVCARCGEAIPSGERACLNCGALVPGRVAIRSAELAASHSAPSAVPAPTARGDGRLKREAPRMFGKGQGVVFNTFALAWPVIKWVAIVGLVAGVLVWGLTVGRRVIVDRWKEITTPAKSQPTRETPLIPTLPVKPQGE